MNSIATLTSGLIINRLSWMLGRMLIYGLSVFTSTIFIFRSLRELRKKNFSLETENYCLIYKSNEAGEKTLWKSIISILEKTLSV